MPKPPKTIDERFWEKVAKRGPDECWLWLGAPNTWGYGQIRVGGTLHRAHRLSYELNVGTIPAGLSVCHSCDVPACVNPRHLFLGTHKDNMADRQRKGRSRGPEGEKSATSIINEGTAREIKAMLAAKVRQRDIAEHFGIKRTLVADISAGRTWRHI